MKIRINGTNEIKELYHVVLWQGEWREITEETLTDANAVQWDYCNDIYTMDRDAYDWWADYIATSNADWDRAAKLGVDLHRVDISATDWDGHHYVIKDYLDGIESENNK